MPTASSYTISDSATLKEVIGRINESGGKQLLVLNAHKKVLGVIGDGDVRRAVFRGVLISAPVIDFMTTSFIAVEEKNEKRLRELFAEHLISTIPVINHRGQLLKVATISGPDYKIQTLKYAESPAK